jgi:N-acetylglucosamine transport system permease protein
MFSMNNGTTAVLRTAANLFLLLWLIVSIYPIIYLFTTSLRSDGDILSAPFAPPWPPILDNYYAIISGTRVNRSVFIYFGNSVIVTVGTLLLLLVVSSMAGYAMARGNFRGNQLLQQVFLLALAVPAHVLIVPIYFYFGAIGLRDNLFGMILLYTSLGTPFTTILMRAYFVSFPRELEEVARVDGCSRLQVFLFIVLPISRGSLASMAIINLGWVWSELFFALALLSRLNVSTLPLAVAAYRPTTLSSQTVIGPLFAIMSFAFLPLMLIYFLCQKQIRKGITAGALK